jgi:tetratricopeptide (TPR) repeat protein
MKKTIALLALSVSFWLAARPGWAAGPRPGAAAAPGKSAPAGQALLKFLPRSSAGLLVVDIRRVLAIDAIAKAMQDPKFRAGYDENVKKMGIDPAKDIAYAAMAMPAPDDLSGYFMPSFKSFGLILDLKYDRARVEDSIMRESPGAKKEIYGGVTVFSWLAAEGQPQAPGIPAGLNWLALLDATHIALGDEPGVRGIIDVLHKKAEPVTANPEVAFLLDRTDKSGLVWGVVSYPAGLVKKTIAANPQFKAMEALKGMTLGLDDKNSILTVDLRTVGGTQEQNAVGATNLNGLRAAGALTVKEPALVDLLNATSVTAGKDFIRTTATVSHETLEKLWQLARPLGQAPIWRALTKETDDLREKGDYEAAARSGQKALELAEKAFGPDHPDTAGSVYNLGLIYVKLKKNAEAEPLFRRALEIVEKALGPDDPRVATALNALSSLYFIQHRYREAEPFYKRLLAVREKSLGPDHPDVAETLYFLGGLYDFQDRDAEAEPLFRRSLAIREKALGPDHPDVAVSLGALAGLYVDQDRDAEAEPLYKRAVAILEGSRGPNDPSLAIRLVDLAKTLQRQGRYAEAEPLFKRAVAIQEKALGPDHPDVAESLNDFGVLYHIQGRFAEAEPLYKRSLAIREKALGPDAREVADSLKILAELFRATKREKEARELEARAARIRSISK